MMDLARSVVTRHSKTAPSPYPLPKREVSHSRRERAGSRRYRLAELEQQRLHNAHLHLRRTYVATEPYRNPPLSSDAVIGVAVARSLYASEPSTACKNASIDFQSAEAVSKGVSVA